MTYREKLEMMNGYQLIMEAEKLGVKISHKGRALKISKDKAIEKILAAVEAQEAPTVEEVAAPVEEVGETPAEVTTVEETPAEVEEGPTEEEPAPAKKERKPRKKREMAADIENLLQFVKTEWVAAGGFVREPKKENAVFNALCAEGGRQVLKLMWTTKKISLYTRIESVTKYSEKWQKINYALPFQCMYFTDIEENRNNIKKLFTDVLAVDSVRVKKEKKTAPAEVEKHQ